jgi:hypothetical protein
MYSWKYFISLPGIKDLDPREQARQFFVYQSNAMLEASNNSLSQAAAASSAAGSGGGGGLRRNNLTGDNGVLFMDNYDTNYKFFIIDESGVNSKKVDTGIVANDWNEDYYYSLQSKGYVIKFVNVDNNDIWQFLFVRANGTIVGKNIVNGTDINQYDQKNGKYFYYNEAVSNDNRKIVYFDGDEVYTHIFNFGDELSVSTAHVAWNSNEYIYETEGWQDTSTPFTDNVSASGLIVYDNRDGDINKIWYSVHKGTITELFQEEDGYSYDVSWDFQSSFLTDIRFGFGTYSIYSDISFYSTETGTRLQTVGLTASEYTNVDYLYYGTGKFSALFQNSSEYFVVTYDGVINQIFTKTIEKLGTGEWDFFATTKTPSFEDAPWSNDDARNFISENIVFVFQNNGVYTAPLYYWDNISLLGVFDGATQSDLITLDGYGIDSVYGSGMFTENVFTMLADSTGTASNPGQASQLIISSTGYTFSNFGFSMSSYSTFTPYQLNDSYVYKFYFEGNRDEFQKFNTNGTRLMTATFSPNNYTWNTGKLFVIENNDENITYFTNEAIGNSPSSIEALGLTMAKAYDDNTWSTYYNTPDNINDGKLLLSGNDYAAVDNFVLLTSSDEPVYLDFSYLDEMDGFNVHLCKTFIIVQFRDLEGNGFARTYDYEGNLTQDLSFGYCEWISNDSVVGDIGVIRFTNSGTTKRVFLTKYTYSVYDLDWSPYDHWTIFNDYYWWRD